MTASFIPPTRILMGPGPSDVPQHILDAMARPTIGHLDPAFVELMEQIKAMLRMAIKLMLAEQEKTHTTHTRIFNSMLTAMRPLMGQPPV